MTGLVEHLIMYIFRSTPTPSDYTELAQYIRRAPAESMHPDLVPRREMVSDRLERAANSPELEQEAPIYHTLRLFVW